MLNAVDSLAPTITTVVLQTDPQTAAVVAVFILILISWSGFTIDVFTSNEGQEESPANDVFASKEDQEATAETISPRDTSSKDLSTDKSKSKVTSQSSDGETMNQKPDEEELKSDHTAVDKEANQEIDVIRTGSESIETDSSADGETGSLGESEEATQSTVRQQAKEQNNQQKSDSIPQEIPDTTGLSIQYDDIRNDDPLGKGGNADVYQATTTTADGQLNIAVKEPRMSGTVHTDTVERRLKEDKTWQKLDDHDHIVGVVDYGSEPLPWIAMEYMDAGHLGNRAGNLELDQALWTAIATTMAVRHAH